MTLHLFFSFPILIYPFCCEDALNLIKNRDLITEMPQKLNEKAEGKEETKIELKEEKANLVLPTLFITSTLLIVSSVISRIFLYIGLFELLYAIHIYRSD